MSSRFHVHFGVVVARAVANIGLGCRGQCRHCLAIGGCARFETEVCVSVSGVAGPTGGTEEKPVGTVWIGIHGPSGTRAECFRMGMHRERNIRRSGLTALNLLRKYLEAQ